MTDPQTSRHPRKAAFTLMEMMLVVAVIAILSAILMPMGNKVVLKGKIATLQKSLKDFETAVDSYRQEYGRLPIPSGQNAADQKYNSGNGLPNIMLALRGDDGIAGIPNPKKINFFDSDLVGNTGLFKDPWGHDIEIYFDANFDNVIEDAVTGRGDLQRTSAAISPGPDGLMSNDAQKEDDVSSLQRTTP